MQLLYWAGFFLPHLKRSFPWSEGRREGGRGEGGVSMTSRNIVENAMERKERE